MHDCLNELALEVGDVYVERSSGTPGGDCIMVSGPFLVASSASSCNMLTLLLCTAQREMVLVLALAWLIQ